jgi:hypothetical protein
MRETKRGIGVGLHSVYVFAEPSLEMGERGAGYRRHWTLSGGDYGAFGLPAARDLLLHYLQPAGDSGQYAARRQFFPQNNQAEQVGDHHFGKGMGQI